MTPKEMIYKRKSVRSYTGEPVNDAMLEQIRSRITGLKPLYPEIGVRAQIVTKEQVRCLFPWVTPQLVAIFSEKKPGWLENAGFLFQQLELYLQSIGLGACWLGMGRLNAQGWKETGCDDGMEFVITLAFGYPKGSVQRELAEEFKRRSFSQIADWADERLEPARLAPSSVNSQPWYFTHDGETIHAYCAKKGLVKAALGDMNRIDMGIALAHMYIANEASFQFFQTKNPAAVKGYQYIGSFSI